MAELSREEASRIVDKVRLKNGGTTEKERQGATEAMLEAYANIRTNWAKSLELLAVDLYSKSTRFVFELIQNAEDNEYRVAKRLDKKPFVRFNVTRERVVIDSNEDGFSKENFVAICQVGQTTKKEDSRGYIGEKGIGFKSVFTVASNVRVQSGPFAFYFNYGGRDDDELGLVTPFNCDHEELPTGVRTRFTLTLRDDVEYSDLLKEFTELPDTLLLFLTTLKSIQTSIHDGKRLHERRYEYLYNEKIGKGRLVKYSNEDEQQNLYFLVRKKTIYKLPPAKTRGNIADAEVVLAFPVAEDESPIIASQHVCAYLPMRKVGFTVSIPVDLTVKTNQQAYISKFQIQSDFVTQTNREDIPDSPWNRALRDGVSEVFVDAIVGFFQKPNLQYSWLLYLPSDAIIDPFWAQLRLLVVVRLKILQIIRTHETEALKRIDQVRFVPKSCCDEEGEPLFEDLPDEIYLSFGYSEHERSILRTIGLRTITKDQFWDRLKADLRSESSRMKSPHTSASWHSSCAGLILHWAKKFPQTLEIIKSFEMIPLQDGSWTSIKSGPVYYHDVADVKIPTDLGLRLIAPSAVAHPARKELFDAIGVGYCDPTHVKKLIVGKYAKWNNVNLGSSVGHLHFLFQLCPEDKEPVDRTMFLFDTDQLPVYRIRVALGRAEMIVDDIYLDIPGAYHMRAICPKDPDANAFNIHLINPAYMANEKATSSIHSLSWRAWLEKHAGVLQSPRLVDAHNPAKLSRFFNWIIEKRSNMVLGVLKTHWKVYDKLVKTAAESTDPTFMAILRTVKLRCSSGEQLPLCDTFLPLGNLLSLAAKVGAEENLRFLQLPSDLPKPAPEHWHFLSAFGTGVDDSVYFYLEALRSISSRKSPNQSDNRHNLIRIYEAIEAKAKFDDHPRVRLFFQVKAVISARSGRGGVADPYSWFRLDDCVYRGPEFLETHRVLENHDDFRSSNRCKTLFSSVLQVPDADWSHTIGQICREREKLNIIDSLATKTRISLIYRSLLSDAGKDIDWESVRMTFEDKALIYVPSSGWYSPTKCVWSDHNFTPEICPIADYYPGLKTFFVQNLKVPSPTLHSQIKELQLLCSSQQNVSEKFSNVKVLIKEINARNPQSQHVQGLLDQNIIPIIDIHGQELLVKPTETFVIVDREKYCNMFNTSVAVLAVPFEELRSIRNFLVALYLEKRCVSYLAHETSEARNAFPDAAISQDFRKRAIALVRCAIHYESPDVNDGGFDLYCVLQRTLIYQSDEITTMVSLELDGDVLATQRSVGIYHLESDESRLKIYVPKNEDDRTACFYTQLPERLASIWSIRDKTAVNAMESVLTARSGAITRILSEKGIPETPDLKRRANEETDSISALNGFENLGQAVRTFNAGQLTSSHVSTTPSISSLAASSSFTSAPTLSGATTPEVRSISFSTERRLFSPEARSREAVDIVTQLDDYTAHYVQLLDNVVDAGEEGDLPTNFGFSSSRRANPATIAINPDTVFGIRSRDPMAHDTRVGAAGELYAFEVLQYRLNDFSLDNWRSTIRHHVSVHQKYNNITRWTGRETADIVYEDETNELTRLLIAYGYLPFQVWAGETPTYYLEVKTTNGPCDTKFYMSKAQVRRMRAMRLDPTKASADIYVILRVFNLTSEKIGMRILVDPGTMEQVGKLSVEADQYTVEQRDL